MRGCEAEKMAYWADKNMGLVTHQHLTRDCEAKYLPGGEHNSRIVGEVLVIESRKTVDSAIHESRTLGREDQVVGNTDRLGDRKNDLPVTLQERVQTSSTADIEVHVNAAKVMQNKVSDRIRSLDWELVRVIHVKVSRVVSGNEFSREIVSPKHVLAVGY